MGLLINVDVPDTEAGIRFYTSGLGFKLQRTLFNRSVAELTLGTSKIYLIEHPPGTEAIPGLRRARTYERHWTPVHLDLIVEDVDRAVAQAIAAGAARSGEQTSYSWGKLAPLSDPFGHGFCLLQFSDMGYGAVAD